MYKCSFCGATATYDAKMKDAYTWAYMCDDCYERLGSKEYFTKLEAVSNE
jgi:uncharacterized protein YlaI